MKDRLLAMGTTLLLITLGSSSFAGNAVASHSYENASQSFEDTAYTRIITERAGKIVATLDLPDSAAFYRVRTLVAGQYRALNAVYTDRDDKLQQLKNQSDKNTVDSLKKIIQQDVDGRIEKLHTAYLAQLATQLDSQQIVKVKDGMTYSVLGVTYRAYLQQLPNLTDDQKAYILAALTEAREHAMDAESSEKKHAWFGKYKGRINNYLSSQGISMKK